ncbi:hypothetical protein HPB48_008122 [Haemaphysalis longicornis]|uniref:Uncharacterized protein n=1 Tax=Haemaphysalis longicornis TaxID=44386 RepID=A0A9J6GJS5_HAELO|nr:hypothetical protein HPB48_008122 [Haemaphysalis longicornis]
MGTRCNGVCHARSKSQFLPYSTYHNTTECLSEALTPCESSGGKKFLLNVMEHILGGTLDLICGRYTRGSDDCKTLPSLPPLGPQDPKVENFVELLIGIVTTFGRKS